MTSIKVVGEIISPGLESLRETEDRQGLRLGTVPGVELSDSARIFLDLDSAISSGDIPIEEVTGGVRVDAETGEVDEPDSGGVAIEWDEEEVVKTLRERRTRVAKGMRRFNSRTFRRRPKKDSLMTSASSGEDDLPQLPTMPKRTSAKERRDADAVLKRHSQVFKSNRQASIAY